MAQDSTISNTQNTLSVDERYCKKCCTVKSVSLFYKQNKKKSGYHYACKECCTKVYEKSNTHTQKGIVKTCVNCNTEYTIDTFLSNSKKSFSAGNICYNCIVENNNKIYLKYDSNKVCKKCNKNRNIKEFSIQSERLIGVCRTCKNEERRVNKKISDFKTCNKCNELKSVVEFYNKKQHRDGRDNVCKICTREYLQKYIGRKRNPSTHFTRMRSILKTFLRAKGIRKNGKTEAMLGYNMIQFKQKFPVIDKNITVDHTIPVSWFSVNTPCNIIHALDNLELMGAQENISKNNNFCGAVNKGFYSIAIEWVLPEYKSELKYK